MTAEELENTIEPMANAIQNNLRLIELLTEHVDAINQIVQQLLYERTQS